jgi:hypothetical protein
MYIIPASLTLGVVAFYFISHEYHIMKLHNFNEIIPLFPISAGVL